MANLTHRIAQPVAIIRRSFYSHGDPIIAQQIAFGENKSFALEALDLISDTSPCDFGPMATLTHNFLWELFVTQEIPYNAQAVDNGKHGSPRYGFRCI